MGTAERRGQDFRANNIKKVDKENTIQAWTGPKGSRRLRLPEFIDNRHMKVVFNSGLVPSQITADNSWR